MNNNRLQYHFSYTYKDFHYIFSPHPKNMGEQVPVTTLCISARIWHDTEACTLNFRLNQLWHKTTKTNKWNEKCWKILIPVLCNMLPCLKDWRSQGIFPYLYEYLLNANSKNSKQCFPQTAFSLGGLAWSTGDTDSICRQNCNKTSRPIPSALYYSDMHHPYSTPCCSCWEINKLGRS